MLTDNANDVSDDAVVVGLFGAGGFAREVMPLVRATLRHDTERYRDRNTKVFFVETEPSQSSVNGYPIISAGEFFEYQCHLRLFNIAIADSHVRERLANECLVRGAVPLSLVSNNSVVYDFNEIGVGAILCANTTITSNATIGRFFHANIYSYVAHDCVIGDYVTFAPDVHCNGSVHIQAHAYIGSGAVIKQGSLTRPLMIGEGAIVGMGAVVTRDVPAYSTVIGNPARLYEKA